MSTVPSRTLLLFLAAGLVATPVRAQLSAPGMPIDTLALRPLHWRRIGPFRSGRSVAAEGSVKRPLEYYSGTTG